MNDTILGKLSEWLNPDEVEAFFSGNAEVMFRVVKGEVEAEVTWLPYGETINITKVGK